MRCTLPPGALRYHEVLKMSCTDFPCWYAHCLRKSHNPQLPILHFVCRAPHALWRPILQLPFWGPPVD